MSECIVCHRSPGEFNGYRVRPRGLCPECSRAYTRYVTRSADPDLVMWAAKRAYAAGLRTGRARGIKYQRAKIAVHRKKWSRKMLGCQKFDRPQKHRSAKFDLPKRRRFR